MRAKPRRSATKQSSVPLTALALASADARPARNDCEASGEGGKPTVEQACEQKKSLARTCRCTRASSASFAAASSTSISSKSACEDLCCRRPACEACATRPPSVCKPPCTTERAIASVLLFLAPLSIRGERARQRRCLFFLEAFFSGSCAGFKRRTIARGTSNGWRSTENSRRQVERSGGSPAFPARRGSGRNAAPERTRRLTCSAFQHGGCKGDARAAFQRVHAYMGRGTGCAADDQKHRSQRRAPCDRQPRPLLWARCGRAPKDDCACAGSHGRRERSKSAIPIGAQRTGPLCRRHPRAASHANRRWEYAACALHRWYPPAFSLPGK